MIFVLAAMGSLVLGYCLIQALAVATTEKNWPIRILGVISAAAVVVAIVTVIIKVCQ